MSHLPYAVLASWPWLNAQIKEREEQRYTVVLCILLSLVNYTPLTGEQGKLLPPCLCSRITRLWLVDRYTVIRVADISTKRSAVFRKQLSSFFFSAEHQLRSPNSRRPATSVLFTAAISSLPQRTQVRPYAASPAMIRAHRLRALPRLIGRPASSITSIGSHSHALAVAAVNVKAYFIATKIDLNLANGALCGGSDRWDLWNLLSIAP